jgi:hypothetical protein
VEEIADDSHGSAPWKFQYFVRYQKTLPHHGLKIRPDIIVHIPFERGRVERRDQGNFVAMELKLRASENDARGDFENLVQMREVLGYPLTIFINVGSAETFAALCPDAIRGQTICFAVRLEDGKPVCTPMVLW